MSVYLILYGLAVVLAGAVLWWLLSIANSAPEAQRVQLRFDALRVASTSGVLFGGALLLFISARKQWLSEYTQYSSDYMSAVTENDLTERRVGEQYTSAAEQLGSDKPAVRLAGVYAFERLAISSPGYQASIMEVLCAYLRMPFTVPNTAWSHLTPPSLEKYMENLESQSAPSNDTGQSDDSEAAQELQVRIAVQDVIARAFRVSDRDHKCLAETDWFERSECRPEEGGYWTKVRRLDLRGATLMNFNISNCFVEFGNFHGAVFVGYAEFSNTIFGEVVSFKKTKTFGALELSGLRVGIFEGAQLYVKGKSTFAGSAIAAASLVEGKFDGPVDFSGAVFATGPLGNDAVFYGAVDFSGARFSDNIESAACFYGGANFESIEYHDRPDSSRDSSRVLS